MFSDQTSIGINGIIKIPGDKSISHRSIIIPSISNGICEITNILKSDDVLRTIDAFKEMGVEIIEENENISDQDNIKKTFTEFYNLDDDLLIEMGQTAKTHSLKYEKIVEKYSTILQERKIIN